MPRSVIAACVFRVEYMGIPLSRFILCLMFRIMCILQQRQVSVLQWTPWTLNRNAATSS